MPSIRKPDDIPFVNQNTRGISASGYNGLIDSARTRVSMSRGASNRAGMFGGKDVNSLRYWVRAKAHADISPFSIFTIQPTGDDGFNHIEPNPATAIIDTQTRSACVYLTNLEDNLNQNLDYFLPSCDLGRPFIFKYDPAGGEPVIGNRIGPIDGQYHVSLVSTTLDFTVISDPDTDNYLVWCIRVACGAASTPFTVPMFEFTTALVPGYTGTARVLMWDAATEAYILSGNTKEYILYDPEEQNMFLPGERVHGIFKTLLDSQSEIFSEVEIVGEHGLHRKVLVDGAVDCGQVGDTFVYTNNTKVHPPPKTSNRSRL